MDDQKAKEKSKELPPYGLLQEYSLFSPRIYIVKLLKMEEEKKSSERQQ